MSKYWKKDIANKVRTLAVHLISILVDGIYLSIWAVIQFLVNNLIIRMELSTKDEFILPVFQWIFFVSTLIPVILFIVRDLRIMIINVGKEIEDAKKS